MIKESNPSGNINYIKDFEEIAKYIYDNMEHGDLVLTMGAGDVYKIGEIILKL